MKILIVDDSMLLRTILKQVFDSSGKIAVVGEAKNGKQAIELNRELKPDLITMDIDMPEMNGLEATRIIAEESSVPILILSNRVDAKNSYKALQCGAVEAMRKPDINQFNEQEFSSCFIEKIVELAAGRTRSRDRILANRETPIGKGAGSYSMIVVGTSTGGPVAVREIFSKIPKDIPVGIAMVQHIEQGFDEQYVEWLNEESELNIRLAQNSDSVLPGDIVVAPAEKHIIFRGGKIYLDDGPKVLNQKPSVDLLFKSASESFGNKLIAILLTGMGSDGAEGCLEIKSKQGFTIVQDRETSTIFGMPKEAIDLGAASVVLPLGEIPDYILRLLGCK